MTLYRITNILNTSLTIEDLGLILAAGEHRLISADAYSRSEDIQRQSRYLKTHTICVANTDTEDKVIARVGHERPIVTFPAPPVKQDLSSAVVKDSAADIIGLEKKIDGLYSLLNKLVSKSEVNVVQSASLNLDESRSTSIPTNVLQDPMFIPKSIIPNAKVSTETVETHIDRDIGDSKKALKKARNKSD